MAHDPILWLTLTIGAYAAGVTLQRLCGRHPALNPTLIAIAIVATALLLLHADYPSYFVAAQPIHLLLGPAVVALAVPCTATSPWCANGRHYWLRPCLLVPSPRSSAV